MPKRTILLAAGVFLLVAAPLAAQARPDRGGTTRAINISVGTLGLGLEAQQLLNDRIAMRLGGSYAGFSMDDSSDGDVYDLDLRARSGRLVADLFPLARGSFRFSGGILLSDIRAAYVESMADGIFVFNDTEYTSAEVGTVTRSVRFPRTAPYVGVGFGRPGRRGLAFLAAADLGVGIGTYTVSTTASRASRNPQLAADLETDRREMQEFADRVPVFPVLASSFSIRF